MKQIYLIIFLVANIFIPIYQQHSKPANLLWANKAMDENIFLLQHKMYDHCQMNHISKEEIRNFN